MSVLLTLAKLVAGLVAAVYIAVGLSLYVYQARFLFPGAYMPYPAELDDFAPAAGFKTGTIKAHDGADLFLLSRAPGSGKPIVIVFHGNGSYPESYGFLYAGWVSSGYGVVAPAARGYPRSSGRTDGEMMLADALEIHDWVRNTYPGHPVIVFGQSLGTSSAIHISAHRSVAGVILISPFKSMLSLVAEKIPYLPISLLLKSPFRSDLDIPNVSAPILALHGDRDTLVPISSARALLALARTTTSFEVIRGAGHAEGMFEVDMIERIARFIEDVSSISR